MASRVDQSPPAPPWTRQTIEVRLIAAFRAMPDCPVYARQHRFKILDPDQDETRVAAALDWAAFLDRDPDGRKYLWAWARCRATHNSFGALCGGNGWSRSTAEAGRRRAAAAIAKALNAFRRGASPQPARDGFHRAQSS